MLSSFQVSPLEIPYPILPLPASMRVLLHPPIPDSSPWHSPTLRHQALPGPRASPPIDVRQGHPLLHMQLESWVPPCVLLGWWFSPWKFWGIWLVDIVVLPMELQTQLLWSFFLTPPLGSLCSVQWLAVSICFCICQALAEHLRRQL